MSSLPTTPLASPAELAAALSALGVAVYTKDGAGRYTYLNAAAAAALHLTAAAAIGSDDAALLEAPLARALRTSDQAVLAGQEPALSDHLLEGEAERREFLAVRVPLEGGGLLGVWLDRSEHNDLAGRLQQALSQLEEQQRVNQALRREAESRLAREGATRLVRREQFDDHLVREIDLSLREHREFAVVYVTLDAAPEGSPPHDGTGRDLVLDALGTLLRNNTRAMDAPSRLDGERFAVLLSGVGLATAHARMEGLRRQCATQLVVQGGDALRFTVSMGVASFPHTAQTRSGLLDAAEGALRQAQERGGNHVALASIAFGVGSTSPV